MTEAYVRARCLLLFNGEAEVIIPERGWRDPVRVSAAEISEASGVPRSELPGTEFEVAFSGTPAEPILSEWRRV